MIWFDLYPVEPRLITPGDASTYTRHLDDILFTYRRSLVQCRCASIWATSSNTMKHTVLTIIAGVALLTAGCRSSVSSLPPGARVVGGGLKIEYSSSQPGTAILVEKTTGKTVATKT